MTTTRLQLLLTLVVVAAASVGGCTSPMAARMPPRDSIPADAPPEVRKRIKRLYSWDVYARSIAAHELGELEGREAAVPFLIALLPDETVAWYPSRLIPYTGIAVGSTAAETLIAIGGPAIDPLLATMAEDPSDDVRGQAARCLGAIERGRADRARSVEALLRAATELPSGEGRGEAAWALGQIKDPRAVDVLLDAYGRESAPKARRGQCEALAALGDPRAVPLLTAALRDDEAPIVRWCTATALQSFKSPEVVAALIAACHDPHKSVRTNAVVSLGKMDDPRIAPALVEVLRDELPATYAVTLARDILWRRKDDRINGLLLDLLESDHPEVRERALGVLSLRVESEWSEKYRSGDPSRTYKSNQRMVPAMLVAIEDRDAKVRALAAEVLGHVGDPRGTAPLVAALDDRDRQVREQAAEALNLMGWSGAK